MNEKTAETIGMASEAAATPALPHLTHAQVAERLARLIWGITHNAGRRSILKRPLWWHVSDVTGFGSAVSSELCRSGGLEPDSMVGGREDLADCGLDCDQHAVIEIALSECAPTEDERDNYMERHPEELPVLVRILRQRAVGLELLVTEQQRQLEQQSQEHKAALSQAIETPVPMLLFCPLCTLRHVDEGEFATKPHHTHACQGCGFVWRPAPVCTFGVRFLPGFKNGDSA